MKFFPRRNSSAKYPWRFLQNMNLIPDKVNFADSVSTFLKFWNAWTVMTIRAPETKCDIKSLRKDRKEKRAAFRWGVILNKIRGLYSLWRTLMKKRNQKILPPPELDQSVFLRERRFLSSCRRQLPSGNCFGKIDIVVKIRLDLIMNIESSVGNDSHHDHLVSHVL